MQPEWKNVDTALNCSVLFPTATSTGVITLLNGVAQGVSATTRTGRNICLKKLYGKIVVNKSAGQNGESALRAMIVYDRQSNAALPTALDILSTDNISGQVELGNSSRFDVAFDRWYKYGSVNDTTCVMDMLINLNNREERFNAGTTGVIGSIVTGAMYLVTYSNGTITSTAPAGTGTIRIMFTDE